MREVSLSFFVSVTISLCSHEVNLTDNFLNVNDCFWAMGILHNTQNDVTRVFFFHYLVVQLQYGLVTRSTRVVMWFHWYSSVNGYLKDSATRKSCVGGFSSLIHFMSYEVAKEWDTSLLIPFMLIHNKCRSVSRCLVVIVTRQLHVSPYLPGSPLFMVLNDCRVCRTSTDQRHSTFKFCTQTCFSFNTYSFLC